MKVFVVEDEQRISQFLKKGLTEKGYSVDVAGDADAALERIAAAAPDLVILDLLLPGSRDGVELCRELRARGVRAKILMLTARDTVENKIEGLDAGADGEQAEEKGAGDGDRRHGRDHRGSTRIL